MLGMDTRRFQSWLWLHGCLARWSDNSIPPNDNLSSAQPRTRNCRATLEGWQPRLLSISHHIQQPHVPHDFSTSPRPGMLHAHFFCHQYTHWPSAPSAACDDPNFVHSNETPVRDRRRTSYERRSSSAPLRMTSAFSGVGLHRRPLHLLAPATTSSLERTSSDVRTKNDLFYLNSQCSHPSLSLFSSSCYPKSQT
jgi:hypothetical protein